jgi:riboflavin kinase/FMN adenylyltransferase
LGFPTVNIKPENEIVPKFGVYVTYFYVAGRRYRSVTNIGVRPTFAESEQTPEPTIETYVFDLDRDLYGERVRLDFCFRLRDERKFPSPAALIEQIRRDVVHTDRYFDFVES